MYNLNLNLNLNLNSILTYLDRLEFVDKLLKKAQREN
jgi:hypothetical protein